ncbi:serine hydrolase domain-containing protein [Nonomuraea gerenzanensis]|uniref:Beta-lactamase class C and other penicillin binding proteins n=1 Tax=Nonomuraea gerenzanensis TaxID=93944 RepID=A0A1M4E865_9ACTN|nr:serine hydrolase domain-containing protein [Nonomuraea gerenzanensis]UBU17194.1 beta-lactamase family protein [Nonomuraea gerenzanensis]SBO94934.1 Beta-lactamase class C and other penicillin binding proteins [Nonomuraea gerenzanensis]
MSDRLEAVLADAVPRVCAAAVALIAANGSVAASAAAGELVRYTDAGGTLAADRPPARLDSIFDLASVSKLCTTVVLLRLAEEGRLGLDEPVAHWIPGTDPRITPRRLLTHTAGLPPIRRIDRELPGADAAARMAAMVRTPIGHPVGGPYLYSDVGMVMAGRLAELAGGAPLDALVRTRITDVLGLADTGYRPARADRVAATECKAERPGPGCVRGEVHDETAYALGGVAGHAGVFATAGDLLAFGEMLRRGGGPVLRPHSVAEMTRDQGAGGAPFRHGLGVRIGDPGIVGPLDGAYGHSGFTGTSLVIDPARRLTVVLLTNAVHPVRGRDGIRELRHAVASEALRLVDLNR